MAIALNNPKLLAGVGLIAAVIVVGLVVRARATPTKPDYRGVDYEDWQRLKGYQAVWDERPLPTTPGTGNFAFDTLQLWATTPAGTGIVPFQQIALWSQQLYANQGIPVVGVPSTSGQMIFQPLTNPYPQPNGG